MGLGYVGLPTSLAFVAAGQRVLGVDISTRRLASITSGAVDLVESDRLRLSESLEGEANLAAGSLTLTSDVDRLASARTVIICVPTPVDEHLVPDLGILRSACDAAVQAAVPGQLLILTSTTYVGTTRDLLVLPLAERGLRAGSDVFVAFSPERIDPGNVTHTHEAVPRVVGGATARCTAMAAEALGAYVEHVHQVSSLGAAEMTKLVENTFRAVNIALANEFADIGSHLGIDVIEVLDAAATKPFGFTRFTPGAGVGGHCIPCDPHYLLWQLRKDRLAPPLIEQAMTNIAGRPRRAVERCREMLSESGRTLFGARILLLGVAYKPNVEDARESPALEILARLRQLGAEVAYHDPLIPTVRCTDGELMTSLEDPAAFNADLAVLHTAHASMDLEWLASVPSLLDTTYTHSTHPNRSTL